MIYFDSRVQAGQLLADQLEQGYQGRDAVVIALSDGGVIVGAQIATRLEMPLTLLLTAQIDLPHEPDPLATIDQDGGFTYNAMFPAGVLEDLVSEYRGLIEEEKLQELQKMTRLLGSSGLIKRELLRHKDIILVSDGLSTGFSVEAAVGYLKTIDVQSIVIATPLATVSAMDRLHVITDAISCLGVVENYISTDHYYNENSKINHDELLAELREIDSHWKK